jgi:hypothetical protein
MIFAEIKNSGKIYLAVTNTFPPRKIFVCYNNKNNFTYFSTSNNNIDVKYPDDFYSINEINLSEEIVKYIQSYGSQY